MHLLHRSALSQEEINPNSPRPEAWVHRTAAPLRLPSVSTTRYPASRYRTPGVLEPIELLDLLELNGTTAAAAQALGLSQPTVSRRSRRLIQELNLKGQRPKALQALRYSETTCLRLLRRASQWHRLEASAWRLGGSPWMQPLLHSAHHPGGPPLRFRHPRAWQELVHSHCLDGALVSGLDLRELLAAGADGPGFDPRGVAAVVWEGCRLQPLGSVPLGLLLPPGSTTPLELWCEVVVPAQQDAPGLASWVRQQQWRCLHAPRSCQRPGEWAVLLQQWRQPLVCPQGWAQLLLPTLAEWRWQALPAGDSDPLWLLMLDGVRDEHPHLEPLVGRLAAALEPSRVQPNTATG